MSAELFAVLGQADALRAKATQVFAPDPVGTVSAELKRAQARLGADWAAAPRGALEAALRLAAVRLLLAADLAGDERFADDVERCLPTARCVARVMRPDTLALSVCFLVDAPLAEGCEPRMRGPYVVATLVAGLERLAAPSTAVEAA